MSIQVHSPFSYDINLKFISYNNVLKKNELTHYGPFQLAARGYSPPPLDPALFVVFVIGFSQISLHMKYYKSIDTNNNKCGRYRDVIQ